MVAQQRQHQLPHQHQPHPRHVEHNNHGGLVGRGGHEVDRGSYFVSRPSPKASLDQRDDDRYVRILDIDSDPLYQAVLDACDRVGSFRVVGWCKRRWLMDILFESRRDAAAALDDIDHLRLASSRSRRPIKTLLKPARFDGGFTSNASQAAAAPVPRVWPSSSTSRTTGVQHHHNYQHGGQVAPSGRGAGGWDDGRGGGALGAEMRPQQFPPPDVPPVNGWSTAGGGVGNVSSSDRGSNSCGSSDGGFSAAAVGSTLQQQHQWSAPAPPPQQHHHPGASRKRARSPARIQDDHADRIQPPNHLAQQQQQQQARALDGVSMQLSQTTPATRNNAIVGIAPSPVSPPSPDGVVGFSTSKPSGEARPEDIENGGGLVGSVKAEVGGGQAGASGRNNAFFPSLNSRTAAAVEAQGGRESGGATAAGNKLLSNHPWTAADAGKGGQGAGVQQPNGARNPVGDGPRQQQQHSVPAPATWEQQGRQQQQRRQPNWMTHSPLAFGGKPLAELGARPSSPGSGLMMPGGTTPGLRVPNGGWSNEFSGLPMQGSSNALRGQIPWAGQAPPVPAPHQQHQRRQRTEQPGVGEGKAGAVSAAMIGKGTSLASGHVEI
ncbi:hypothetical protein Esi_0200_0006 [Ectocarpus siliculosus]|uniref:RRM domain-containing protein n=1 Tax=Ectocarpus siliculosus TaxID=2880 RepID=D7FQH0_ECTSI|nr:hypothetical protein Esi_0200_0006 [Ectocarpus siliculosus]|eukprot:CBJ30565.1 hypothetical protein Esi_0200_0006 [Ectocarpus siliculosus]